MFRCCVWWSSLIRLMILWPWIEVSDIFARNPEMVRQSRYWLSNYFPRKSQHDIGSCCSPYVLCEALIRTSEILWSLWAKWAERPLVMVQKHCSNGMLCRVLFLFNTFFISVTHHLVVFVGWYWRQMHRQLLNGWPCVVQRASSHCQNRYLAIATKSLWSSCVLISFRWAFSFRYADYLKTSD